MDYQTPTVNQNDFMEITIPSAELPRVLFVVFVPSAFRGSFQEGFAAGLSGLASAKRIRRLVQGILGYAAFGKLRSFVHTP